MPDIRESIEEMIEESYLLNLSEAEIKADLDRFIETCGKIIREHVRDRRQMQKLIEKLARARAISLIEDQQEGETMIPESTPVRSSRERFAQRVARNKRLILRTIAECDPKLVEQIERERFPGRPEEPLMVPVSSGAPAGKLKNVALKTVYAVVLLFILLLVYLVLLQNI